MTPEQNAKLETLLEDWFRWEKSKQLVSGYKNKSMVVGDCRGYGLQYESQIEQQYAENDIDVYEALSAQVEAMKNPYQAAIYALARNLATGNWVWLSPRLPANKAERDLVVDEAKLMLAVSCGIL